VEECGKASIQDLCSMGGKQQGPKGREREESLWKRVAMSTSSLRACEEVVHLRYLQWWWWPWWWGVSQVTTTPQGLSLSLSLCPHWLYKKQTLLTRPISATVAATSGGMRRILKRQTLQPLKFLYITTIPFTYINVDPSFINRSFSNSNLSHKW
jgi:hypothetical protein